jgi:hypothetical protein
MSYKWKPSKTAKREFAQNMQNPEFLAAYYGRKRAEKRRSLSSFDYETAGGNFVPTKIQYDFAMSHSYENDAEKTAFDMVVYGYGCKEKIHHDYIHIINEKMRAYNLAKCF